MIIRHSILLTLCACAVLVPTMSQADEPAVVSGARESWRELLPDELPRPERVWLRGEYLAWLSVSGKLIKLVRSNDFEAPSGAGRPGSGDSDGPVSLKNPLGSNRQGYRLTAGAWLEDEQIIGIEGALTYLSRDAGRLTFQPGDRAVLGDTLGLSVGVPTVERNPLRIGIVPVRIPDLAKGGLAFEFGEKTLFGGELLGRVGLAKGDSWRIDGLAGYRYLDYRDSLRVVAGVITVAKFLNPGTAVISADEIKTKNTYNGALLGFQADATTGNWTFSARPRISIASAEREVSREGRTEAIFPDGGRFVAREGTYLLKQDMGVFRATEVTVIPELDLGISYSVTPWWRVFAGTSGMYLPVVAKANNQLQLGIRPERIPPGVVTGRLESLPPLNSGEPPIRNSLLFMTMSLGMEFRF